MFEPARGDGPEERYRVLQAAASVLERTRYQSLKVRQVLTAAEVSTSTFYRYFTSKSDLMLALLREDADRMKVYLVGLMAEEVDPVARVEVWLRFGVRIAFDVEHFGQFRVYLDHELMRDVPRELAELNGRAVGPLREVIEEGTAQGIFHSGDAERDARAIHYYVRTYLMDIANGVLDRDPETA